MNYQNNGQQQQLWTGKSDSNCVGQQFGGFNTLTTTESIVTAATDMSQQFSSNNTIYPSSPSVDYGYQSVSPSLAPNSRKSSVSSTATEPAYYVAPSNGAYCSDYPVHVRPFSVMSGCSSHIQYVAEEADEGYYGQPKKQKMAGGGPSHSSQTVQSGQPYSNSHNFYFQQPQQMHQQYASSTHFPIHLWPYSANLSAAATQRQEYMSSLSSAAVNATPTPSNQAPSSSTNTLQQFADFVHSCGGFQSPIMAGNSQNWVSKMENECVQQQHRMENGCSSVQPFAGQFPFGEKESDDNKAEKGVFYLAGPKDHSEILALVKDEVKSPIVDFVCELLEDEAQYGHICSFIGTREFRIHNSKMFMELLNLRSNQKPKSYLQISRALKSYEERKLGGQVLLRKVKEKRNQFKFFPDMP